MKCQTIAADTLRPRTLCTFDELDYSMRESIVVDNLAVNAYGEGEAIDSVAYDHFPASDTESFFYVDPHGEIHAGIYGTFELSDLIDDTDNFPRRQAAEYGRVTVPAPTITTRGDVSGEWGTGMRDDIQDALIAGGYWDGDASRCWACAGRICDNMRGWTNELSQWAFDTEYENMLQYDEGLYDEDTGEWVEYIAPDYRMPIEDPDADMIECPDADAARACITYHCKTLGYRERAILDDMAECVRVQFDASHEVWRVTDTAGRSACFDLTTGRICN